MEDTDDPLWPIKRAIINGDAIPLVWVVKYSVGGDSRGPIDEAYLQSRKPFLMALVIRDLSNDHVKAAYRQFKLEWDSWVDPHFESESVEAGKRLSRANAIYHLMITIYRGLVAGGYTQSEAGEKAPERISDYFRDAIDPKDILTIQEVIAMQQTKKNK